MKANLFIIKASFILFVISATFSSCTKDDQIPDNKYFVSKELAVSFKKDYIVTQLNTIGESIEGVTQLIPLVKSDIDVYSITYKTTIGGKEITASGLVAVPTEPGEYPVLSFQNGTNTVNAYAPSQFPIDFSYQMIEAVASMGYVVVIADYPGFGASSNIPHPYLVKDPTVQSLVDMLFAAKELVNSELPGISLNNDFYLLGYSQGGWATLALDKALELDYSTDFNLKGSVCGAGPYNILLLLQDMVDATAYPMPVYLGYIINAYSFYNQFTNPVTDLLNEPYASRLSSLYTGLLTFDQINNQLTNSIPGLLNPDFLAGFSTSSKYSSVRDALTRNSVSAWKSKIPLLLIHGGSDAQVNPISTENMYTGMLQAGTADNICTKVILSGYDHGDGVVPSMIQGILFLMNLNNTK